MSSWLAWLACRVAAQLVAPRRTVASAPPMQLRAAGMTPPPATPPAMGTARRKIADTCRQESHHSGAAGGRGTSVFFIIYNYKVSIHLAAVGAASAPGAAAGEADRPALRLRPCWRDAEAPRCTRSGSDPRVCGNRGTAHAARRCQGCPDHCAAPWCSAAPTRSGTHSRCRSLASTAGMPTCTVPSAIFLSRRQKTINFRNGGSELGTSLPAAR
jgi:hypothetical protein